MTSQSYSELSSFSHKSSAFECRLGSVLPCQQFYRYDILSYEIKKVPINTKHLFVTQYWVNL